MPKQLSFDLPVKTALGREDYFVSDANRLAVDALEDWQEWPNRKMILTGPAGSGKTHLLRVWAEQSDGLVISADELSQANIPELVAKSNDIAIEDAQQVAGDIQAEHALFHLHNLIFEEGGHLLLSAATPPSAWPITLADLASRMQACSVVSVASPDDALLAAVMVKQFNDRQLSPAPEVIDFLLLRTERSFESVRQLVDFLDRAALEQQRTITIPFARTVLD